jgi:hypothetical protein
MEARVFLKGVASPAKDLSKLTDGFSYEYLYEVLMDPSRRSSPVLISLAKPIPLAQFYDKASTALEDSVKEDGM